VLTAMQVLNFYSTIFADQLKRGRKTATIRLGDKSHKYKKNQAVLVTIGYQHSPREKIFDGGHRHRRALLADHRAPAERHGRAPRHRRRPELAPRTRRRPLALL
jgi:hypothetical protein